MINETLVSLDDKELLQQLSVGNHEAFDRLYDKYWQQVFNMAYKRLGNELYAQDITQDIFINLWSRGTQTLIDNVQAYLYTAVRNGVFKHFEKEKKYQSLDDAIFEAESLHQRADSGVLYDEFLNSLHLLVNKLPQQQKTIFKMRFDEGLSTDEIAKTMELSVKTVRNHLGRALSSLKQALLILSTLLIIVR